MLQCFEVNGIEASGSDPARAKPAWTPPQWRDGRKVRLFSRLSQAQQALQKRSFALLSSGISAPGTAGPGDLLSQKKMRPNSWKNPHPENIWMFSSQYCWQLSKKRHLSHIYKKTLDASRGNSCRAALAFSFRFEPSASWQRRQHFPRSSRPRRWSSLSRPGAQPLWMPLSLQILAAISPAFVPMQKKNCYSARVGWNQVK